MVAPSAALTATPVSSIRGVEYGESRQSKQTSNIAARAPQIAAIGITRIDPTTACPRVPSDKTIARLAPAETPRMPGSARSLRRTPWSTAPETAIPPPTSIAKAMRGSRNVQSTSWTSAVPWPSSALEIVIGESQV